MSRARIRSAARQDLLDHATWLAAGSPAAALRFLDAAEATIGALGRNPRMGHPARFRHPLLKGMRTLPVAGFEGMLVFHLLRGETPEVVRILHGARDLPGILLDGE